MKRTIILGFQVDFRARYADVLNRGRQCLDSRFYFAVGSFSVRDRGPGQGDPDSLRFADRTLSKSEGAILVLSPILCMLN